MSEQQSFSPPANTEQSTKREKQLTEEDLLDSIKIIVCDTDYSDPKATLKAQAYLEAFYKQSYSLAEKYRLDKNAEQCSIMEQAAQVTEAVMFITADENDDLLNDFTPSHQTKNLFSLISMLSLGKTFDFKKSSLAMLAHPSKPVHTSFLDSRNPATRSNEYNEFVVKGNLEKRRTIWDIQNKGLLIRALYILSRTLQSPEEIEAMMDEYVASTIFANNPDVAETPPLGQVAVHKPNVCGNIVGLLEVMQNMGLHDRPEFKHFTDNLVTAMYRSMTPEGASLTTAEVIEDIQEFYQYSVLDNPDIVGDLDVAIPVNRLASARSGKILPKIGFNGVTVAAMSRELTDRSSKQVITDIMELNPHISTNELNHRIQQAHFDEGVIANDHLTIPRRFLSSVRAEVRSSLPGKEQNPNSAEACTRALQEITRFFETDQDFQQLMSARGKEIVAALSRRQIAGGKGLPIWETLQRDPLFGWLSSFSEETADVLETWSQDNPGTMYLFLKTMMYRLTGEMSKAEPENKFLFDHEYGPKGKAHAAEIQTLIRKLRHCFNQDAAILPSSQRDRMLWAQKRQLTDCAALLTPEARLEMRNRLNEIGYQPNVVGIPLRADLRIDRLTYVRLLSILSAIIIAFNGLIHLNAAYFDTSGYAYNSEHPVLMGLDSIPFMFGSSEMEYVNELLEYFADGNNSVLEGYSVETLPDGLSAEELQNTPIIRVGTLLHYPKPLAEGERAFFLPFATYSDRLNPETTKVTTLEEYEGTTVLIGLEEGIVQYVDDITTVDINQYKNPDTVIYSVKHDFPANALHIPPGYELVTVIFETPDGDDVKEAVSDPLLVFTDIRGSLVTQRGLALPNEAIFVLRELPVQDFGRTKVVKGPMPGEIGWRSELATLETPDFDKAYRINNLMQDGMLKTYHRSFIDEYRRFIENTAPNTQPDAEELSEMILRYQLNLAAYVNTQVTYTLEYDAHAIATAHYLPLAGSGGSDAIQEGIDNTYLIAQSVQPGGYCQVWSAVTADFFTSVLGPNFMISQNFGYNAYAFEGGALLAQIGHATNTMRLPNNDTVIIDNTPSAPAGAQLPDVFNGISPEQAQEFLQDGPSAAQISIDFLRTYSETGAGLLLLGSLFALAKRYNLPGKAREAFIDTRAKLLTKLAPELPPQGRDQLLPALADYITAQPHLADKRIGLQHIVRVLLHEDTEQDSGKTILSRPSVQEYLASEGFSLPDVDAIFPGLPPTDGHLREAAEHVLLMLKHAVLKQQQPLEDLAAQLDAVQPLETLEEQGDEVQDPDEAAYAEAIELLNASARVDLPEEATKDEEELHSLLYQAAKASKIPAESRTLLQALSVAITGKELF